MIRFFSAAFVVATAIPALAAAPEIRGTWVTTTGITTGTIANSATTTANFAKLRAIGLNTVYQDIWRNGTTYFDSSTAQAFDGVSIASDAGRDVLSETLIQAHRNGMSEYGWLQYGFATQYLSGATTGLNALTTKMKANGWLLQDSSGNYSTSSGNKYAWMNPLVPQVQDFIIGLGVEAVTKYDLDGIEFDDRLAWPTQFGYDAYTKAAYLSDTGKALPSNPNDAAFTLWRSQKITQFAQRFSAAIRAANSNAKVAAAPGISTVYSDYAVDTPSWAKSTVTVNGVTRPTFDEITPQVYSSTSSYFTSALNTEFSADKVPAGTLFAPGISANSSTGTYDWASVNKLQVDTQRAKSGTSGQIWWYSDGVLNTDAAALTAYYNVAANGQAARPDRAADYRPAPIEGASAGGGKWSVTPDQITRYSVIALVGATWSEVMNTVLLNAPTTLSLAGTYSQVELLVDRRGFTPGDANFDGKVDQADLAIYEANAGQPGKMWTQADFTLDGKVDAADLAILGQNWGTGVTGTLPSFASLVPEPTSVLAFGAMVPTTVRRRRR